jgi:hypothetical protein
VRGVDRRSKGESSKVDFGLFEGGIKGLALVGKAGISTLGSSLSDEF